MAFRFLLSASFLLLLAAGGASAAGLATEATSCACEAGGALAGAQESAAGDQPNGTAGAQESAAAGDQPNGTAGALRNGTRPARPDPAGAPGGLPATAADERQDNAGGGTRPGGKVVQIVVTVAGRLDQWTDAPAHHDESVTPRVDELVGGDNRTSGEVPTPSPETLASQRNETAVEEAAAAAPKEAPHTDGKGGAPSDPPDARVRATPTPQGIPRPADDGNEWVAILPGALILAAVAVAWHRITLPLAGLFTRITRRRVLLQPTRRRLVRILRREPGLGVSELMRLAGLAEGTVRYHLRVLERHRILRSRVSGRRTRFFVVDVGICAAAAGAVALLRCRQNMRIAQAIVWEPGIHQGGIADRVSLSQSQVHSRLEEFLGRGLLRKLRDGRSVTYEPTQTFHDAMMALDGASGRIG